MRGSQHAVPVDQHAEPLLEHVRVEAVVAGRRLEPDLAAGTRGRREPLRGGVKTRVERRGRGGLRRRHADHDREREHQDCERRTGATQEGHQPRVHAHLPVHGRLAAASGRTTGPSHAHGSLTGCRSRDAGSRECGGVGPLTGGILAGDPLRRYSKSEAPWQGARAVHVQRGSPAHVNPSEGRTNSRRTSLRVSGCRAGAPDTITCCPGFKIRMRSSAGVSPHSMPQRCPLSLSAPTQSSRHASPAATGKLIATIDPSIRRVEPRSNLSKTPCAATPLNRVLRYCSNA